MYMFIQIMWSHPLARVQTRLSRSFLKGIVNTIPIQWKKIKDREGNVWFETLSCWTVKLP